MARKRARTRTTPRSRTKGGKVAKISVVNSGEHGPTVLVIGAGPSGLVSLKTLRENGYNAVCVESSGHIGGTFYNKTYDDGALVSSKYITAFSDFRWDSETRPHPTIDEYLEYLEKYSVKFKLKEHIHFGVTVEQVKPLETPSGKMYRCSFKFDDDLLPSDAKQRLAENNVFDAVAVCSGLHNVPFVPSITGFYKYKGRSIHSSEYKSKSIFAHKRVLVVGCGETGCDVAYRAVQVSAPKGVALCVRRGFLSVPTALTETLPLDTYITNLFECCYQHRWTEYFKLKWKFTTPFIRAAFLLGTGTSSGYNQWAGTLANVKRGYHIINKSTAVMPYINPPLKERSWMGKHVYSYFDRTNPNPKEQVVKVVPSIAAFHTNGRSVEFSDGSTGDFDVIVWCTGYKQKFPFLNGGAVDGDDDPLPSEHMICSPSSPNLAFIGFVRPNVGAIPPMSELQVMYWIQRMRGKTSPVPTVSYRLLGLDRTKAYGVDYGAYMHDLARSIGSAPHLLNWLFKSPRVAVAYALGQSYISFFRLEGPFKEENAEQISANELYFPVLERGVVGNLIFIVVIFIFGIINLTFWLVDNVVAMPVCFLWRLLL